MVYGKIRKSPDPLVGAMFMALEVKKLDPFQNDMSKCPHCGCFTDTEQLLKMDLCYTCAEEANVKQ